jgi:fructose-bisphosphate aldolase, class I
LTIGKLVRLNRLFSHPSGRLCSIAVDHFIGYGEGIPAGLKDIARVLDAIVSARPDAVTMHRGVAASAWAKHAGKLPFILQSTLARVDDTAAEQIATAEDAVRLGADALACAAFIRGPTEAAKLRVVAECSRDATRYEIPLICHIYPRDFSGVAPQVSFRPEDIAWAVRCAYEAGADVVKVPYCGDVAAYREIVSECPVPVVAAGGPRAENLPAALAMLADVVRAGARGATIGRNAWGFEDTAAAVRAFKAVIHDGATAEAALRAAGVR